MTKRKRVKKPRSQTSEHALDTSGTRPVLAQRLKAATAKETIKLEPSATNEGSDSAAWNRKFKSLNELGEMNVSERRLWEKYRKKLCESDEQEEIASHNVDGGTKKKLAKATEKVRSVLHRGRGILVYWGFQTRISLSRCCFSSLLSLDGRRQNNSGAILKSFCICKLQEVIH